MAKSRNTALKPPRDVTMFVLGAVISAIISYYFYAKTLEVRRPIFVVEPTRTIVFSKGATQDAPITVFRSDGTQITSDITSIRFYFWNHGKRPLKAADVLRSVQVKVDDPQVNILDFRVLHESRDVISATLSREQSSPANTLLLSFSILEQGDGITGQIMYEGNPQAPIAIAGTLEGVKRIGDFRSVDRTDYIVVAVMALMFSGLGGLLVFIVRFLRYDEMAIPRRYYAALSLMILFLMGMFIAVAYEVIYRVPGPGEVLSPFIPETIRPAEDYNPPTQFFSDF